MSTVTLRPNSTVTAADSVTGAASAHAAAADDSDSTYFTDGNNVVLGLETHTLSTSVTKSLTLTLRGRADSGGPTNADVRLRSGSLDNTWLQFAFAELTTITNQTQTAAVSLTQEQLDELLFSAYQFSPADLRVYEVTVVLTYVTIPSTTVTAVSPDPYTASTTIPIAWSNTLDSDGGTQTRYEIKVYTDAQYGAGDFDPDTSTPYYTTGVVISAAESADVGPLPNADTYRAYVRVAQTVNGAPHWSAWAYDEFTIDVDTSDVDTVTAVADNSTGSIEVTVARDSLSEAWNYVEVQRSIDGGATWTDVRRATYVDATGDANEFVVVDYETPNGQSTIYRARATRLSSGLPVTGAWVEASATSWTSTDQWLKAPNDPTLNITFCMSERVPYRRDRRVGVFRPLGSSTPVAISDVRSKRSSTLVLETYTAAEATDVTELLEGSSVLLIQYPSTMDIDDQYAAVIADEEMFRSDLASNLWRQWAVEYIEVDAPADPTAGR